MCIVSEFFEKDIRKEDATKTRETDTILSKRPWDFTIHSGNSKDWISFPSTNKTLGDSRKRKPFSPPCFCACAENSWKRNRQESARDAERKGTVSCSQVAITVELFVYRIQLLCSFSDFNIAYYMYFLEAVITSHFHFDFTHPKFSYEN